MAEQGVALTERQQDAIQQLGLASVEIGVSLGPITRLGVGGPCGALVQVADSDQERLLARWVRRERLKLTRLERGTPTVVRDGGVRGVVVLDGEAAADPLPGVQLFVDPARGSTAGELLERSGLLGVRIRGARIDAEHPNRLVNVGDAQARDIEVLIALARDRVAAEWGVTLEPAISMVGIAIRRSRR